MSNEQWEMVNNQWSIIQNNYQSQNNEDKRSPVFRGIWQRGARRDFHKNAYSIGIWVLKFSIAN